MTDTVLVLAWLVLAHLIADFVLQNDWIAINKATGGRNGWAALSVHGFHVGLCLVPAVLAFGLPGLAYLLLVAFTHVGVDRWKVRATRRAEQQALDGAMRRHAGRPDSAPSGLGIAWTPWPGMLFLADQALHLTIALVGWVVIVEGRAALLPQFVDAVNRILGAWDRGTVHAVVLTSVVLVSLFLVNTRAAYYFILALVSPRDVPDLQAALASVQVPAVAAPAAPAPAAPAEPAHASASATNPVAPPAGAARAEGMTVQVGPMVATIDIAVAEGSTDAPGAAAATAGQDNGSAPTKPAADPTGAAGELAPTAVPSGAPARIGATIGALERLLIVTFVLVNAIAAVGFVIAAKTLARFKQLDDRGFAEYYLLGTLASASVAIGSALVAQAALSTLP